MALFAGGFKKYLESGDFSDLEIVLPPNQSYKVHRMILIYHSDYFRKMLTSEFREAKEERIEINFPDPHGVFPEVLLFMYRGRLKITWENVISLLSMSDQFLIPDLRDQCTQFLSTNINRTNALRVLHEALEFRVTDVIDKCVEVISRNFSAFCNDEDWNFLPIEAFLKLLNHEYLAVKDEFKLYVMVCKYIDAHKSELNVEKIQLLMECIRFRWMTVTQMKEVEKNPLVPRHLVIEALMFHFAKSQDPTEAEIMVNKRLQPRISFGMQFEFGHDFDHKGIFYWISTNGLSSPWANPHLQGLIVVNSSSIERGKLENLVSRTPTELWTKDVPASWVSFDLGQTRSVLATHYTIRHGGNYRADSLRTWDLQGSSDGRTWSLLKRHANDCSLNAPFATHTWPLEVNRPFRFFRVIQTGHNSSGHNFLVICGFELYGDLYETINPLSNK